MRAQFLPWPIFQMKKAVMAKVKMMTNALNAPEAREVRYAQFSGVFRAPMAKLAHSNPIARRTATGLSTGRVWSCNVFCCTEALYVE